MSFGNKTFAAREGAKSVNCFERSNRLDTARYKTLLHLLHSNNELECWLYLFLISSVIVPVSQFAPSNPAMQVQLYPSTASTHAPPF